MSGLSRRPWPALLLIALLGALSAAPLQDDAGAATLVPPFASTSPFNVAIRASPALDANSYAMVARAARTASVNADMFEFGIPIYTATATTARSTVTCTMSGTWGICPVAGPRRIPVGAESQAGSDGAMAVVDTTDNTVDEYWQAYRSGSAWTTTWGAVNSLAGSGWGGSSTGSGASRIAGVVGVAEIRAGIINHALAMQVDNVCTASVRAPAIKTDGDSTRADCIPEGARIQLDPSINLAALSGITAGERAVARAMQVYGAYVIDRGGSPMSLSFELAPDGNWSTPGSAYAAAGLSWDFYAMPHVPWSRLRVLQAWSG